MTVWKRLAGMPAHAHLASHNHDGSTARPQPPGSDASRELTLVPSAPAQDGHGIQLQHLATSCHPEDPSDVPDLVDVVRRVSPLRAAILSFSSIWFLVPQGLGITACVLFRLDYQFRGLRALSYVVWAATAVSLLLMCILYAVRAALDPHHVAAALGRDAAEVACFSSVSIAFTSVVMMLALALGHVPAWAAASCALWWANAVVALLACTCIPYYYLHVRPPGAMQVQPSAQLPLVAAITLAAGGGVVAGATGQDAAAPDALRLPIALVSFLFLGLGMPLALALCTAYLVRVLDGRAPAGGKVYQDMILTGPWSQGSFALQALGGVLVAQAEALAAYAGPAGAMLSARGVEVLGYGSMFAGFMSWGQATFWWFFATASVGHSHASVRKRRHDGRIRYSLAEWSLVFPWGVYTNAAVELGKIMNSAALRVWSAVLTVALVLIILVNLAFTVRGLVNGSLLYVSSKPTVVGLEAGEQPVSSGGASKGRTERGGEGQ